MSYLSISSPDLIENGDDLSIKEGKSFTVNVDFTGLERQEEFGVYTPYKEGDVIRLTPGWSSVSTGAKVTADDFTNTPDSTYDGIALYHVTLDENAQGSYTFNTAVNADGESVQAEGLVFYAARMEPVANSESEVLSYIGGGGSQLLSTEITIIDTGDVPGPDLVNPNDAFEGPAVTVSLPEGETSFKEGDTFDVEVTLSNITEETTHKVDLAAVLKSGEFDASNPDIGEFDQVVFAPGEYTKTVTVNVLNDKVRDETDSFTIEQNGFFFVKEDGSDGLVNDGSYSTEPSAEFSIEDTTPPLPNIDISLSSDSTSFKEGDTVYFDVELTNGEEGVDYYTSLMIPQNAWWEDMMYDSAVSFRNGQTKTQVAAKLYNDLEVDDGETFELKTYQLSTLEEDGKLGKPLELSEYTSTSAEFTVEDVTPELLNEDSEFGINDIVLTPDATEVTEGDSVTINFEVKNKSNDFDRVLLFGYKKPEGTDHFGTPLADDFDVDDNTQYVTLGEDEFSGKFTLTSTEDEVAERPETFNFSAYGRLDDRWGFGSAKPVEVEVKDLFPPTFDVTYGLDQGNDGDVIAAGDGVTVTGTYLVPGEEYTFQVMFKHDGMDGYVPADVDTDQGKANTFTLTSENPTFSESDYSFGELPDELQSRGYSFYLQRVDGQDPTTGDYTLHSDQITGDGFDENTAVTFTIINDEYVAPVSSGGGGGSSSPAPVSPEPDIDLSDVVAEITEVEVPDVVIPEEVVEAALPTWNLPTGKADLRGGDAEDFERFGKEDLITGSGKMKGDGLDDFFRTYNEDDKLFGRGGDDFLRAGAGDDLLKGGKGDDVLFGGKGDDVLRDGKGDDFMVLGAGDDTVYLGSGDNFISDFNESADSLIAKGGIEWDGNVGSYDNGTVTLI